MYIIPVNIVLFIKIKNFNTLNINAISFYY